MCTVGQSEIWSSDLKFIHFEKWIPQCFKGKNSLKILSLTSKPITSRPRPPNLRTSPRATHQATLWQGSTIGPFIYTKAKRSRTFIAFCRNVPPGSQKFNKNIDETLKSDTQPLLKTIFTKPPITSYKKGKFLKRYACESKNITWRP